jgi:hypothetical protein
MLVMVAVMGSHGYYATAVSSRYLAGVVGWSDGGALST